MRASSESFILSGVGTEGKIKSTAIYPLYIMKFRDRRKGRNGEPGVTSDTETHLRECFNCHLILDSKMSAIYSLIRPS